MKKILIPAFLILAIAGGFYIYGNGGEKIPAFRTASLEKGAIISTVNATGTVEPITLVQVGSQVSGTIAKIYVDYNDEVKEGQVLCELDKITLKARVEQEKANLLKAKAQILRAEANLFKAERTRKRSASLGKDNLLSSSDVERDEAAYKVAAAELELAHADEKQADAALRTAEANLEYATIYSPVNGVVISRNVDVGQTVAASFQAPVLFEIAENLDKVHILASVGEADIGSIKAGQDVTFTVDAHPSLEFTGKTIQIRLAHTLTQNVVTYTVVVDVDNTEGSLLPGMTANLEFQTGRTPDDSIKIPNLAIRFEPEPAWVASGGGEKPNHGANRGTRRVWTLDGGLLVPVEIKTGITDGTYTQLLSGDLREGREVVTGIIENDSGETELRNPFERRRYRPSQKKG